MNISPVPDPKDETIEALRTRLFEFQSAIQRIASHVGACCGGVDTARELDGGGKPFGPGGHTGYEICRKIDEKLAAARQVRQ